MFRLLALIKPTIIEDRPGKPMSENSGGDMRAVLFDNQFIASQLSMIGFDRNEYYVICLEPLNKNVQSRA